MLDGVECPSILTSSNNNGFFPVLVFTFPLLLWFLPLVACVVLIHVINMFRHRRVEWAAMEFLLVGYRRSRTRILLKQFLLLVLRMLAIALIIFMLAEPKLTGLFAAWSNAIFGEKPTHHIILLDDSYSMNDRNLALDGESLFQESLTVIKKIAQAAAQNPQNRLTVVRLSRVNSMRNGTVRQDAAPDLAALTLDSEGQKILDDWLENAAPSDAADAPQTLFDVGLEIVKQVAVVQKPVVYFLSDFRSKDWTHAESILEKIQTIQNAAGQVRMIRAGHESAVHSSANLCIDKLEIVDGIHAVGIDLFVDLTVTNFGDENLENVPFLVRVDDQLYASLVIPSLKAGETLAPPIRFPVRVDSAGNRSAANSAAWHRLEVSLPPDAIPNDNVRRLALNLSEAVNVLLIVPEARTANTQTTSGARGAAPYVRAALSPSGIKSGIRTVIEPTSFLADNALEEFDAIFLLDLPEMPARAIESLEKYVVQGGGLAMFTGSHAHLDFIRDKMYRDGTGLFPFSPLAVASLEQDFLRNAPDVSVLSHPIFRLFRSEKGDTESPFLRLIRVEQYLAVQSQNEPQNGPASESLPVNVIGILRNGSPLVIEKTFGKGRTVTVLTSPEPTWNNWARGNPSFVVVMLDMVAWLAGRPEHFSSLLVGDPLEIAFDANMYENRVELKLPPRQANTQQDSSSPPPVAIEIEAMLQENGHAVATFQETTQAGFYETRYEVRGNHRTDGQSVSEPQRYDAVNVNPQEGETALADITEISTALKPLEIAFESAAGVNSARDAAADFFGKSSLTDFFLILLLLCLVGETFLAGRLLPPLSR